MSKYDEIRDQQRSLHKGKITLLPGEKQPSIPAIHPEEAPPPLIRAPTDDSPVVAPAPQPSPQGP